MREYHKPWKCYRNITITIYVLLLRNVESSKEGKTYHKIQKILATGWGSMEEPKHANTLSKIWLLIEVKALGWFVPCFVFCLLSVSLLSLLPHSHVFAFALASLPRKQINLHVMWLFLPIPLFQPFQSKSLWIWPPKLATTRIMARREKVGALH